MKPVDQDIFINDPQGRVGNCLQACVASLLEKDLTEVPHFAALSDDTWFSEMCNWITDHGYEFDDTGDCVDFKNYVLAIGPSPRGVSHAVIYYDGKLAHDPHPSRAGILDVKWAAIVRPKNQPWQQS